MKKYILILSIIFLTVSPKAESSPKHNHFKKPLKLSDIQDLSDTQCDLCGCYMGLEPNFDKNQIGLRYYTFKFFNEAAPADNNPLLDHDPQQGESSDEYYNNVELYGRIYLSLKTRLIFGIPFSFNEIDNKALNGVGDLRVLAQYNVYNTSMTGMTNFWQRIFLGGGMKFPTGVYNKQLTFGITEPHFQPGTGSLDFLFTGLYIAKLEKVGLGWRNDVVYTLNTTNKNDYKFANRFNWASTFSYDIITSSVNILPKAGIYLETASPDQLNGADAEGSGGTVWMGTMGIDLTYKMLSLDFDYQLPISQNFIGVQPQNDYRFFVGMGYSF
ncbi:MAG: hypothetical protein IPL53_05520 [Ignavibacteria bacterium]|nr:hypothetical protein [Ignavibacteria bacterium]